METNGILTAIRNTRRGLSVQMKRMEVTSENISHADRYPDENGAVYQRKTLRVTETERSQDLRFGDRFSLALNASRSSHFRTPGGPRILAGENERDAFEVEEVPGEKFVYEPDHPQADEQGYVRTSNVNMVAEMIDLMTASRVYEANVTVLNSAKQIAKKSLEL